MKKMNEMYFSFFMGRLLGDQLKETLCQIRRERQEVKNALTKSQAVLNQSRLQLGHLRERGLVGAR